MASDMPGTIRVERVRTSFNWPDGASARIWIVQPENRRLQPDHPPWAHPADDAGAWPLVQKLAALSRTCPDPTFVVVPELCLSPTLIGELRELVYTLPQNVALVAGMGHLTYSWCRR